MGFATDCIHAGQEPDPATGAIITPIFQTSTYVQEGLGRHKGYEYARTQNPTRRALEKNLAALEGGTDAYCFASGMAATQAVLALVEAGQRVVVSDNVYGGTHRLFTKVLSRCGIASSFLDASDARTLDAEAGEFAMLWIETPTNPLMKICDIAALAEVARKRRAILAVDNTFLSPFLQRPLALGADVVVHSTTKFLNGHSDSVGGVAVVRSAGPRGRPALLPERRGRHPLALRRLARSCAAPRPWPCACRATRRTGAGRGVPARAEEGAQGLLAGLPRPPGPRAAAPAGLGLRVHDHLRPGRPRGRAPPAGHGAAVRAGREPGRDRDPDLAPATMTHAGYTQAERDALGISDGLVRISVGCEDAEDILADLQRALDAV
jgi:O-acetylhomoserine/O-acetylserine sulfhydrylase-like pyridoxal-dependent enzyme